MLNEAVNDSILIDDDYPSSDEIEIVMSNDVEELHDFIVANIRKARRERESRQASK